MTTKNILLGALAGAAVGAAIASLLDTEKGKQFLSEATGALKNQFVDKASGNLKDMAGKATDVAKSSLQSTART